MLTDDGVLLDAAPLLLAQRTDLAQDGVGNTDLAHIVEEPAKRSFLGGATANSQFAGQRRGVPGDAA